MTARVIAKTEANMVSCQMPSSTKINEKEFEKLKCFDDV
jgi:hypothetical protein|tara:strand:+ start:4517 stop:4633 length:117 start_codon:yes stop_codon:yes gene_type:complete